MSIEIFLQTLLLGIVEGLTEFLPVSSTGHLILLVDILNFVGPPGRVFEVAIQLGAILAIMLVYFNRLWQLLRGLPHDKAQQNFAASVVLAFLPAMFLGALLHDFIKSVLFNAWVVSVMLIVGGFAILLIERMALKPRYFKSDAVPLRVAFKIGLIQCLAMVPGVSRSGATIMGALCLGLERKTAAEFSFFLALPTMAGAVAYDLYKNWHSLNADSWLVIAIGFAAAFFTALLVVRTFLNFVGRYGFAPFAYYRIILGTAMLIALWHGLS